MISRSSGTISTLVTATVSASGVKLTVVVSGGELTPAVLVATLWNPGSRRRRHRDSDVTSPLRGRRIGARTIGSPIGPDDVHGNPRIGNVAVRVTGVPDATVRARRDSPWAPPPRSR